MYNQICIPDALNVLTPGAQWSLTDATKYNTLQWYSEDIAKPSEAEVNAEIARQVANKPLEETKTKAKVLIAATDWSVLQDVGLSNVSDFVAYRASLRDLIKNPVANPSWPTEPQPIWS